MKVDMKWNKMYCGFTKRRSSEINLLPLSGKIADFIFFYWQENAIDVICLDSSAALDVASYGSFLVPLEKMGSGR